ncbi:hypothetical protein LB545_07680 [Mesorhizobium sp. BR1-1-6]|uniref:hypothetical protein n=1 Tax=Mesorhizobium sp. BR1-1-6 TaxID=2876648 RepID=UPI001CD18DA9|nr:hypothetical protein [Mesorhizobium sp. BR1-1-6]MBZ9894223.1 hypothetical protein [Mesorhizobium sp. BR1-1-6]
MTLHLLAPLDYAREPEPWIEPEQRNPLWLYGLAVIGAIALGGCGYCAWLMVGALA